MAHEEIVEKIVAGLREGLRHPGNPETEQPPITVTLPGFNPVGLPPEVAKQLDVSAKLMAESIIALIETDHEIVSKADAVKIREAPADAGRQNLQLTCRCKTVLGVVSYNGNSQIRIDGRSLIEALNNREAVCPHNVKPPS